MKKYKRFRAVFLALVLALSLMPAMVFADNGEGDNYKYWPTINYDEDIAIFPGDVVEVDISDNWFIRSFRQQQRSSGASVRILMTWSDALFRLT